MKPKVPRSILANGKPSYVMVANAGGDGEKACVTGTNLGPDAARRLAAWLLRYATWAEANGIRG